MTNRATYKRRRLACWLPGKTNREGVKGRMIGSRSQILPTNSNLFLRKSKSKYFQIQEEFQSQLAKSNKCRRQRKLFRCNKANLFATKIWQRWPENQNTVDQIFIFICIGTELKDSKGIEYSDDPIYEESGHKRCLPT